MLTELSEQEVLESAAKSHQDLTPQQLFSIKDRTSLAENFYVAIYKVSEREWECVPLDEQNLRSMKIGKPLDRVRVKFEEKDILRLH